MVFGSPVWLECSIWSHTCAARTESSGSMRRKKFSVTRIQNRRAPQAGRQKAASPSNRQLEDGRDWGPAQAHAPRRISSDGVRSRLKRSRSGAERVLPHKVIERGAADPKKPRGFGDV